MPEWLQRSVPAERPTRRPAARPTRRQVFRRLAGCWTYWGWKGGYFTHRGGRPGVLRRDVLHAGGPDGGPEQPAVVQHRPALGLRHRGPAAGALLRRSGDRTRSTRSHLGLRAPGPARVLHPVASPTTWSTTAASWTCGSARPASSSTAAAPARTSPPCAARASRSPAAASRRGLMSFLKIGDRAAGAIKIGRHHPPRRQDGRPRPRPPGHRGVRQLEGGRGAEGRRPGHRVAAAEQAPERHPEGRPRLARTPDEQFDPAEERRPAARRSSTPGRR